jgi:hypothetical protein
MRQYIDLVVEALKRREAKSDRKVTRDAFLYLDPKAPKESFAQCSTCVLMMPGTTTCAIHGPDLDVKGASCGLYVHGTPTDDQPQQKLVTPEESGFVRREVRCENCRFFEEGDTCALFVKLNDALPEIFDLETKVADQGCCNAQSE